MRLALIVGLGGFLGAIFRYYLAGAVERWYGLNGFPWGIFVVNILGCFLIGLIFGYSSLVRSLSEETRLLLVTGFLGSLTTFSTFGQQTLDLLRKGQMGLGLANIGASVVVGLLAVWLGYSLVAWLRTSA